MSTSRPPLDAECKAALDEFPVDIGELLGGLTADGIAGIREIWSAMPAPELSDGVERNDHEIPDSDGVVVRVHRPKGVDGRLPCVYWIHGGGLVLGSYENEDLRFDLWCQEHRCVGVAVEYRLAPEHPYPAPLDDCMAGLRWVHDNAEMLGVDTDRVGIGGNSAGGGLAAGLALRARDQGGPPISFQLLVYPMIDDRQITPSSQWPEAVWPPPANEFGWTSYLGDAKGGDGVPPEAAAARAGDLTDLPPTFIMVGSIDGFSDEDIDFAVRLRHAGVDVELHVYPGAPHGFDSLAPTATVSRRAHRDMGEWLAAHL